MLPDLQESLCFVLYRCAVIFLTSVPPRSTPDHKYLYVIKFKKLLLITADGVIQIAILCE